MREATNDDLGNRMKAYEKRGLSLSHVMPGETFIVRLDGRAFHTFTKGLHRPFDEALTLCMVETSKHLVSAFKADISYCQSDEITLVFFSDLNSEIMFGGRVQKLISLMAAEATGEFRELVRKHLPEKADLKPIFDARLFTVPTRYEAVNNLIWRQQDAVKNAISMAAQSMFSHKELHGKNGAEMQEMMFTQKGVNFNDYPYFFKRGTFTRREIVERPLESWIVEKLERKGLPIPESVKRNKIREFDCWITKAGETMEERFIALFPQYEFGEMV